METPLISGFVGEHVVSVEEQIDANGHLWLSDNTNLQGEQLVQAGSSYRSTTVYERKNSDGDVVFRTSDSAAIFTVFMIIYPFGALVVFLYYIISYAVFIKRYCRKNGAAREHETSMLSELCENRRVPYLFRCSVAETPMLIGLFRPTIVLPERDYTDAQLRAVLQHELTHLRRKDVLVKGCLFSPVPFTGSIRLRGLYGVRLTAHVNSPAMRQLSALLDGELRRYAHICCRRC